MASLTLALVRLSSARRFTVSAASQSLGYSADDMLLRAALLRRSSWVLHDAR